MQKRITINAASSPLRAFVPPCLRAFFPLRPILLSALLLATGCQSARVDNRAAGLAGGNDPEQQTDFWHRLAEQPITSYDDAFHAVLLFTDGQDPASDYPARVRTLKDRGWLSGSFDQPADNAVDRGTLSVALAKVLKIKGGLVMSLFGPSPRYATKELEFAEIYPASSPNQTFSGSEFVSVITRAEEYQKATDATAAAGGGAGYTPPEMDLKHPATTAPAR